LQAPQQHGGIAGSSRAYAVVLLLVTIFILYGSLFPFEYYERTYPGGPPAYLLSTWRDWDHRGDLLSNILLYIPFGFFGTYALPSRMPATLRVLVTTIAGTSLACGIEITQFHDVGRVTSLGDVYANLIGSGVGGVAAAAIGSSIRWPFVRELAAHPAATVLLCMFFCYRLYPYVPMIDMHKYWHAVRPMLVTPSLPLEELAGLAISWLLIAGIVQSLYGVRNFRLLFPLLCSCEFLGKVLIIDNALTLTDVVGATGACMLWALWLQGVPGRFAILALAFAVMITVQEFGSFRFAGPPHDFDWVPFASFMRGSVGVAIQGLCGKVFEYGGLIWLLGRAGVILPIGTVLTAALLFVSGYAGCWLAESSAGITDTVMVLIIGGVFGLLRYAVRRPWDGSASNDTARDKARFA
jgi:glycopeptide antibiotics resistance protein